jgi:hypothetical protein
MFPFLDVAVQVAFEANVETTGSFDGSRVGNQALLRYG